jgi:hypothetical protein
MKQTFLKTTFVFVVLLSGMILMVPVSLALDNYRGNRLPLGVAALGLCIPIADRSISSLFRRANLTCSKPSICTLCLPVVHG